MNTTTATVAGQAAARTERAQANAKAAEAARLADLIEAVARQDRTAFAALFRHYGPRIRSYLIRLGSEAGRAEDLMQEVMITLWRRSHQFDRSKASAGTWIFTIARNRSIDALRSERRPEIDHNDPALVPEPEKAADEAVSADQEAGRLRAALEKLPREQSDLLRMAYFEDKTQTMIADETGLPLGTVKSRMRLALERMRRVMNEEEAT